MNAGRALSFGSVAALAGLCIGAGAWSATAGPSVATQMLSTRRLSDYLDFPRHIVSGPLMHATLVVNNPGGTVNLTQTCSPTLLVTLVKTLPKGPQFEPMECFGGRYILHHGVTHISAVVVTTYEGCTESSNFPTPVSPCVDGAVPPLPPGDYLAVATWNWPVTYLPPTQPVSVVVTDK